MSISVYRQSAPSQPTQTTIVVDCTEGAETVYLDPAASTAPNTQITVVKKDATSNAATVTVAGASDLATLDSQNDSVTLFCDGVAWSTAEAEALVGTKVNLGVFGDGSDGDRTITDAQSLPNPVFYRNLTITDTGSLDTAGWPLFVSNLLTVNGTLHANGADGDDGGSGGSGGAGTTRNYFGGSNAGGDGTTTDGVAGAAVTNAAGTVGGQGGNGTAGNDGASAGAASSFPDAQGGSRVIRMAIHAMTGESQGELIEGSTGGGGGGGDTTNTGGGGGASGGYLMVAARAIAGTGTISATGGDGGDGEAGDCGGGGGGAGGIVVVVTESPLPATIDVDVSAGVGGAKTGSGTDGSNGEDGVAVTLYGVK